MPSVSHGRLSAYLNFPIPILRPNLVYEADGLMLKRKVSRESDPKLHLRYIRLPNQVLELYDELYIDQKGSLWGGVRLLLQIRLFLMGKWFWLMVFKYLTSICLESGLQLVR